MKRLTNQGMLALSLLATAACAAPVEAEDRDLDDVEVTSQAPAVAEIEADDEATALFRAAVEAPTAESEADMEQLTAEARSVDTRNIAPRVGVLPLTANEFKDRHCKSAGYDFMYCWTNRIGNPWVQRTSTRMRCVVNALTGPVRFRYRIYRHGSWVTLRDVRVLAGEVVTYVYHGQALPRRCEILGNTSNRLHISVRGDE